MRLIAKQKETFVEIFRINFFGKNKFSVIGEYLLLNFLEELIPTGTRFHSHFIYSENGNYHFSIKYYDTVENLYVDRKVFHNHVATRKGISPEFHKDIPYERRDRTPNDMLDMFMMTVPLNPWTNRPFGHQFGLIGITSMPNVLLTMKNTQKLEFQDNDLIVDIDEYSGMSLNFRASLFTKDNPAFDLKNLSSDVFFLEKSIERDNLILRIEVIINTN